MTWRAAFGLLTAGLSGTSLHASDGTQTGKVVFSLYRSSLVDSGMKVHVATFDAGEGKDYNFENCWLAAQLFSGQENVRIAYWCEPRTSPDRVE
jgi:hypothetical protein